MAIPVLLARPPRSESHRARDRAGVQVLTADVFHDVLRRERRRADRFDERFLLLLVSLHPVATALHERASAQVVESLRRLTSGPSAIGWFIDRRVLGLIVPATGAGTCASRDDLLTRARNELDARLAAAFVPPLPVSVCIEGGSDAGGSVDPSFGGAGRAPGLVRDAVKRLVDIVGSVTLLAIAAPLILVVAAAVRLTSEGPILFRQERVGYGGRPFTMLKFRTMRVDADRAIHQKYVTQFIRSNAAAGHRGAENTFKINNDPRITRLGRFLRRTSLDEIPQFWNVLRGEMSLVGPRPPLPYEVAEYRRWHHRRVHAAKPGITGLWQVAGRSRTTFDDMVRLDLRYARTRSLWTDIRILAATPRAVISGKGAC